MTDARQSLDQLGAKRETTDEQRRYLLDISMRFQNLVVLALNGNYVENECFEQHPSLKYANAVMTRNELFNDHLERYGQSYNFKAADENTAPAAVPFSANDAPEPEGKLGLRTTENHADLVDVVSEKDTISKHIGNDTIKWLTEVYKGSRGFELGTFDSSLLAMTMKAQSAKWEPIAMSYISDVVTMAHSFIVELIRLLCSDLRVSRSLLSTLMEDLVDRYRAAFDNARLLLCLERTRTPITLNHYFNDNLEKRYVLLFLIIVPDLIYL